MHRIAIDLEKLKYPNNGLYTFCRQLGRHLPQLAHENEQLLYYLPGNYSGLGERRYRTLHYKAHHRYLFSPPAVNIWHATHQDANVFPRNKADKLILTIHDLNFLFDERKDVQQKTAMLRRLQQRIVEADRVVTISRFTLHTIQEHLQIATSKCNVIYNGAEIKEFPSFDAPQYRPAVPFLFAIGMLVPKKNFHVLPALLQHNQYELVIAGQLQGDYFKKIQEQAALFGVSHRVKLLGPVGEQDKYWYYKHSLAFMFPSLAEGFGIPPVEAMHFGKPVFLSDKTSLPEVGGDVAYYFRSFEPSDMQHVFESGMAHYQQQCPAETIRRHAARFSWEANAEEYMNVYRSLY